MDNPKDSAAWFQLATLIGDPEREKYCLEQVLKIDPEHTGALVRLKALINDSHDNAQPQEDGKTWIERRCPYVGLADDPQSLASYPSHQNYCHKLNEPRPVKIEYQQRYCLENAYQRCLVYHQGEEALNQLQKKKATSKSAHQKPATKPLA